MAFTGPVEDRLAIRELMDTHAHGVMSKDPQLWGSIWAEDAFWDLPEYPDLGGFTGKETIVAAWTASMERYGLDDMSKPMIYFMQPGSIEIDGDHAKTVAYTIEIFDDPETGKRTRTTGRYDDELEKRDGRWLFTRRSYRSILNDVG
ncbi:nuclear transport factor 2 family protein [Novosphingobium album (ex Hu et al. 2023)]|uniref:Nuclear transport factor 2 family protein n=1 Tax=Novosphingobium album (ex Hu et al. 2023) TaxID=2930093 RepID=A0ABT0B0Y4_9SPHN|nr:nuclear transport factor 2 family protein [Novosphingobium album (ex Hu et al. 2023)]MCJ2178751.1 nuclear transport factor 2 family protein [Novosphingobium album (ex Hu et al. 2023)]